jgi:multiple sugar transport system substrate-binding protein
MDSDALPALFDGRSTSRREFLTQGGSALAAATVLGGLIGCGGGSSSSNTVTIGMTSDLFPAFKEGSHGRPSPFSRFEREHKLTVNVRQESSDTDTYFEHIRTELLAGSPDVDVFVGDVSWPPQFGSQGWLADLSGRFPRSAQAAYLPAAVNANIWGGKIYGIPFYWDVGILYYRQDLLERAGFSAPPQTWAELEEMASKVMRDQGVKYGFTFTGANYEGGTVLGMEFIATAGGAVLNGNKPAAGSPEAIKGLTIQRQLIERGLAPPAVANYQEGDVEAPFLAGDSVFLRNWSYQFGEIKDPKASKIHPSQVGVASVPRASAAIKPVNVGGGWNFYIPAESGNQDAAWELAQFMSAAPQQAHTDVTIGYLPTRTALYDDPKLKKANPFSALARAKPQVEQTITPPRNPYYKDMSSLMAQQFNANVRGAQTAEQTAENVQKGLEDIIQKAGGG